MSLINDALKRSRKPAPSAWSTDPQASMQPVEYRSASRWPLLLLPMLLLAVVAGGWFLFKGWQVHRATKLTDLKLPVVARELPAENANPSPPPVYTAPASNSVPNTNIQNVVIEPSKPVFPVLRLQGIFYRPRNPSVLINAKTLPVGGMVAGVRVIAITPESVTLQWNGETKVLTLD